MSIIQIHKLQFGYTKDKTILNDLNLSVAENSIYGFLGINGAGKTTTLRLLLGLLQSQIGTINLFGENHKSTYPHHLQKIGSLIESPSIYTHLSGYDNLKIWSKYFNIGKAKIHDILDLVNLAEDKDKLAGKYSTGMKQRLGLGISLLHDPDLLILDEPTSGLDPMGIIELRTIIYSLRDQGKTIMLSSHILAEVEKIVTHLGIIHKGSIIFEGSLEELHDVKKKNIAIQLRTSDNQKALQYLESFNPIISDSVIELTMPHEQDVPKTIRTLMENGVDIYEVTPDKKTLENLFLSLTNE